MLRAAITERPSLIEMPSWFENFAVRQFRKTVKSLFVELYPDIEILERNLPQVIVDGAYNTAWVSYGKPAHGLRPAIYMSECRKAAEHVLEFYKISNEVRATLVQSPPELPSEERQQPQLKEIIKLDSEGKKDLLHEMSDTLLSFMLWQDSELDKVYAERDLSEFESKELVFLYDATRALYQDNTKSHLSKPVRPLT